MHILREGYEANLIKDSIHLRVIAMPIYDAKL